MPGIAPALAAPAEAPEAFWEDCRSLYLLAPALVNVALNYKVCVEQGLPLHPTYYFAISEKIPLPGHLSSRGDRRGSAFFSWRPSPRPGPSSSLEAGAVNRLKAFQTRLPESVTDFIYTSTQDKYTWRASEPRKILELGQFHPEKGTGQA